MFHKRCPRCQTSKPLTDFRQRTDGRSECYCRPCMLEYKREHFRSYRKRDGAMASRDRRRKAHKAVLRELLRAAKSKPCADCGVTYPWYVMQFDHLRDKAFTISKATERQISVDKLLAEIAKCDIVCANCHAARSHLRRENKTL